MHLLLRNGFAHNDRLPGACISQHLCYFGVPLPHGVRKRRACRSSVMGSKNEAERAAKEVREAGAAVGCSTKRPI